MYVFIAMNCITRELRPRLPLLVAKHGLPGPDDMAPSHGQGIKVIQSEMKS